LEPVAQLLQIDETQRRQTLFIDSGVGFVIIFVVIVVVVIVVIVVVVRRCRFRRFRSYDGLRCRQRDRLMDGVVGDEFEYDRRDGDRALTIRGSIEREFKLSRIGNQLEVADADVDTLQRRRRQLRRLDAGRTVLVE
jgi:hypothetical protein